LQIDHKPIQGRCRNCKGSFDIEFSHPMCTQCGSEDFEMLPDAPLILEEIEFQEE
jgi:Zn finger protein HypA/HybF involved in hydrogenase expression